VHLYPAGAARQFATDAKGSNALLGWLGDQQRAYRLRTGRAIPLSARAATGRRRAILAKSVRYRRGDLPKPPAHTPKTDAIDASTLARMGALLPLPVRQITGEAIDDMSELHIGRSP
jgi:hypothetical protein